MDTSLLSAGRTTHLKIVSVALACALVVVLVGMNARTADIATNHVQFSSTVIKAGQSSMHAGHEVPAIR